MVNAGRLLNKLAKYYQQNLCFLCKEIKGPPTDGFAGRHSGHAGVPFKILLFIRPGNLWIFSSNVHQHGGRMTLMKTKLNHL